MFEDLNFIGMHWTHAKNTSNIRTYGKEENCAGTYFYGFAVNKKSWIFIYVVNDDCRFVFPLIIFIHSCKIVTNFDWSQTEVLCCVGIRALK